MTLEVGRNARHPVEAELKQGVEPAPTQRRKTEELTVKVATLRLKNATHIHVISWMVDGVTLEVGRNARHPVEAELKQGVEPAPTQRRKTEEQTVLVTVWKLKNATLNLVSVSSYFLVELHLIPVPQIADHRRDSRKHLSGYFTDTIMIILKTELNTLPSIKSSLLPLPSSLLPLYLPVLGSKVCPNNLSSPVTCPFPSLKFIPFNNRYLLYF